MDTADTSKQEMQLLSTIGNHSYSVIIIFNLDLYKVERWQSSSFHSLSHVYFSDKDYGREDGYQWCPLAFIKKVKVCIHGYIFIQH